MKRRGNGEGSVYRRRDGRWAAQLAYWQGGRLRRTYAYARTQREALARLAQLRQRLAQGLPPASERVTVADYCQQWLEANSPRLRPSTARRYHQLVRHQILPGLGRLRLSTLTPTAVEQWLSHLGEQHLAPRTIQQCRALLRRILQDATRDGLCARNPAALARPVAVPPPETAAWDIDEAQRFLSTTRSHWLWPLFTVTLVLGLRQGEVLGLSWEDIDLDGGALVVRAQIQCVEGRWVRLPPKSRQSRRALPLPEGAREALEHQRSQQQRWRAAAGEAWRGNPWSLVFTTHLGTPLSARNVARIFHQLCEQAGVPRIRFHDLRHSTATLLLQAGVDLKTVSAILGHSQLSVTADYYAHVTHALTQPALARLSQLLRP